MLMHLRYAGLTRELRWTILVVIEHLSVNGVEILEGPVVTMVVQGIQADLDKDEKHLMKMALKECQRMRDLIRNLQDFNRPTSGQMSLVDLHAATDSILMFGKYSYKSKNIVVKKEYASALPLVTVVADRIKQVLLNLLNNAVDACEESGGTITIGTSADGSGNVNVFLPIQGNREEGKGDRKSLVNSCLQTRRSYRNL